MKTTKILLGALRVSALVALFAVVPAQAQTVNVSFLPHANYNGGDLQGTFAGQGALSDPGNNYWNNVAPTYGGTTFSSAANTLENSSDTALTSVGFTLTGFHYGIGATGSTFANPLLQREEVSNLNGNDGIGSDPAPQGFEVTGLTAGDTYNLFLYAQNESTNTGAASFTFGTTQTLANTSGDTSGFVDNGNYVEFTLVANGSGDISGTWYSTANNDGLNGFQVQFASAPVVPEPASLATMGLGGIALLLFLKRFKKQSV